MCLAQLHTLLLCSNMQQLNLKKKKSALPSQQGFTFLLDVFMTSYVFVSGCNLGLDCLNILSRISEIHLEKLTSGF